MQTLLQEVSTGTPAMAVVDREIGTFRPILTVRHLFCCRLRHVQNDRHAILVVTTLDALVGVRCIGNDKTVGLRGEFGGLEITKDIF